MTMATPETFSCETGRLRLRPLTAGDEALFCTLYTDPEIMLHIGSALSSEQAVRTFRELLAGMRQRPLRWVYLALLDKASNQALGICGLPQFDTAAIRLEVGLVLTKSARSRGVAREGVVAMVNRIFIASSADEVWAQLSRENLAAQRVLVAAGFSACDEVLSGQEVSPKRAWSIHRSCWRDVEPYQQSRGTQCQT